jgi:hypothetical protein
MTMKAAASSLIICSLLVHHPSLASSRQAPFFGKHKSATAVTATSTKDSHSQAQRYAETHAFVGKKNTRKGNKKNKRKNPLLIDSEKDNHEQEFVASSSNSPKGPLSMQFTQDYTASVAAASTVASRGRKASKIKFSDSSNDPKTSRLIQIPMALTLQHDSDAYDAVPVPISTFVDTGAQVTVMTYDAAKRAGIAHLIDTRYAGHASGVAGVSCRVLGRIPANSVSFLLGNGDELVDSSPAIAVLEDRIMQGETVDMLLGLDVLEEWQAMVCLRDRTLTIRNGCRKLDEKEIVISFCGSAISKPVKKRDRGQGERSEEWFKPGSCDNNSRKYESAGKDHHNASQQLYGKRNNPLARDSSLLESELDTLDQRSRSKEETRFSSVSSFTTKDLNDFEENDEYREDDDHDDDDSDSNYFESEDDYDGCDLSGV